MSELKPSRHRPQVGDKFIITTVGMWGHRANTDEYCFAGSKGHYPNTFHRLTRCGDSSIAKDDFMDVLVKAEDLYEGYKGALFEVDKILSATPAQAEALKALREIIAELTHIAAACVRGDNMPSYFMEEHDFPKTTPLRAKRNHMADNGKSRRILCAKGRAIAQVTDRLRTLKEGR